MEMIDQLRRLFDYDGWANRESLASLKAAGSPSARAVGYLGHIVAAQNLWMDRLRAAPPGMAVWPPLTVEQCEAQLAKLPDIWQQYLNGLGSAGLSEAVTYRNTKGESWTSAVQDILVHVVLHSAYHRAQIASELRAGGHAPAYTDFIECVRRGLVK